jgi:hypothetical protein
VTKLTLGLRYVERSKAARKNLNLLNVLNLKKNWKKKLKIKRYCTVSKKERDLTQECSLLDGM